QRGTTTEVTVTGQRNFAGAYRVLFQGEGLTAEIVPPEKASDPKATVNSLTLKVTAAPDAPLGVRELRIATPRGISSTGLLVVGDEPEAREVEPNDAPGTAQAVTLPVVINGRIQAGGGIDQFRFPARAREQTPCSRLAAH